MLVNSCFIKNIILYLLVFFTPIFAFSQSISQEETNRLSALQKKLEGTYQIQIIDSRELVAFPLTTLDIIDKKRHQTKITFFWLKKNVKIMILPVKEISSPNFRPIITRTVYLTS